MIEASCHCGAVTLEVAAAPEILTSCRCSLCRRYGALWAYYSPKQVRIAGPTEFYMWGDKDTPNPPLQDLRLHHALDGGGQKL